MQVAVRPATPPLRCATCHDHLPPRRWVCGECDVALHRTCAVRLGRCPTLGCTGAVDRTQRAAPAAPRPTSWLDIAVAVVPGLLGALWPVVGLLLYLLCDALTYGTPDAPALLVCLGLGLASGPLVGSGLLAPTARALHGPGPHHRNAGVSAAIGLALSALWLAVTCA